MTHPFRVSGAFLFRLSKVMDRSGDDHRVLGAGSK